MKTIRLFFVLAAIACLSFALPAHSQNGISVFTSGTSFKAFAGSLPANSGGTYQKLKIEVFGGDWSSSNLGVTTYYISTRNGFNILSERHGGATSGFALKIYERPTTDYPGTYYDFVVESTSPSVTYTVKAEQVTNTFNSNIQPVNIKAYDAAAAGATDVTSRYTITSLYSTGLYGEIGIGTDNPKNKLDVNGTIRAKEVKIELANWADHVFNPGYDLMDLNELSGYVANNRHLPGIPTSQEVMEDGVDMGKLNVMLLQKIEELTLYTIGQQKLIEKLEKKIENLN